MTDRPNRFLGAMSNVHCAKSCWCTEGGKIIYCHNQITIWVDLQVGDEVNIAHLCASFEVYVNDF